MIYAATAPNGQRFTRKSTRTYTHATLVRGPASGRWFVLGFHGSEALAAQRLRRSTGLPGFEAMLIVGVEAVR